MHGFEARGEGTAENEVGGRRHPDLARNRFHAPAGDPRGAQQSSGQERRGRAGRPRAGRRGGLESRMEVLTVSPRACSISLWSLSPGPMCLRAKSSCLGRRLSRRREAPVAPLSPPPLLLSRPGGAQLEPAPPARRRLPPTPRLRRRPHVLAHDCMDATAVPSPTLKGQLHSWPLFWPPTPEWRLGPA
jgi:hypothetical protein